MLNSWEIVVLACCFFLVAALYSSVGFGGGSSYLALLAVFLPDFLTIKTTALLCNLVVVSSGSWLFYKQGYFNLRKFLPLALFSVPAAFTGAMFQLKQPVFFLVLGTVLAFSGLLLLIEFLFALLNTAYIKTRSNTENSLFISFGIGSVSGLLSGLAGIGGGIILAPALHLLRQDSSRNIAALASFFILVNSAAGLFGQVSGNTFKTDGLLTLGLLIAVLAGSQLGTRLSLKLLRPEIIKGVTGALVFYIGASLILNHYFI